MPVPEYSFREAFERHLEEHGTKMTDIVRATGVSRDVLAKLRARPDSSTTVENGILIAGYYGETVNEFMEMDGVTTRAQADTSAGSPSQTPSPQTALGDAEHRLLQMFKRLEDEEKAEVTNYVRAYFDFE